MTEKGYGQHAPDVDNEDVERIKEMLMIPTNKPFLPLTVFHLKMDAIKAFEEGNYALSVVYIVTSLESLIKIVLSYYHNDQEMNEIDETHSLSKLIRKDLLVVFSDNDLKKHRKPVFDAIETRNDIIHRAKVSLSREQTIQILKDIDELIKMLLKKYSTLVDSNIAKS